MCKADMIDSGRVVILVCCAPLCVVLYFLMTASAPGDKWPNFELSCYC